MPRRGYRPTPETIAKVIATRRANRERLGPTTKRRPEQPADLSSYGADADYCISFCSRRLPHLTDEWEQ